MKIVYYLILLLGFVHPAFTVDCTSLPYAQLGLCMYPLLKETVKDYFINEKMNAISLNASPEITAFIHELLAQHGVKDAQTVLVKLGKEYCSGANSLMIEWLQEGSEFSLLESLIFQYNNLDNAQASEPLLMLIYQQIGSIEHEISHIKNQDCKKRTLYLSAFSLASWGFIKLLELGVSSWCPILSSQCEQAAWKSKLAYYIGSGALLALFNKQFFYKICRNQERAADAMISDNASILLAKANLHTTIYETDKKLVEKNYGKTLAWLCQKFPSLFLFFDWEHPTSYERAQTFTKRLVQVLNCENASNSTAEI